MTKGKNMKTKGEKSTTRSKSTRSTKGTTSKTKKKLIEELKEQKEKNEYLKDTLLRARAELDNFKKRTEKQVLQVVENANADLIKKMLPIIDDLERSLDSEHEKSKDREFRKGIELIYKNLMKILEGKGLEQMHTKGESFDVDLHDAIMQVKKEGIESGVVVDEHQKGYFLNGNVLRHAKVVVSE